MTYKVEVIADSSGVFIGNGLEFRTAAEAETYGRALASRWTLVTEMHEVLGSLARRFSFAFDILPEHELFARFVGQKAASVVCSLVLQARGG